MSKRAEEAALGAYPITMVRRRYDGIARSDDPYDSNLHDRYCFKRGYEQAEKELGWHSVEESLPKIDEEVVVLRDEHGTAPIYKVGVGHIVDRRYAMDFNGWNAPGVKFWMRFPKIPEE